jgi:LPXTG-motif cell wall-anchored protein
MPQSPAHPAAGGAQAEASALGGGGLLTGNTIEVPVDAPVNICGVVVTVLGGGDHAADEHCFNDPGTAGGPNSSAAAVAADNPGALSDNVVQVPVSLPANICGDTVTVVGGHDSAEDILCANNGGPTYSTAKAVTANSPGLVNGNIVQVPVDAPLNVCGITANVAGVYDTAAGNKCANGGEHGHEPMRPHSTYGPGPSAGAGANAVSANSSGAVTGNVVQVPIQAPINACGDSVNVVGAFNSALDNRCVNETAGGAAARATATGNNGLAAGNVAQLPIDIPTEICGVVAAVGAYHATAAGNTCVNTGAPTAVSSATTSGETGLVTGIIAQGSVNVPVHVCGTTVGAGIVNSGSEDTDCGTGPAYPPPPYSPPQPGRHRHRHEHLDRHHDRVPPTEEIGQLPRTGTDFLDYAGIGAGALLLGAGAIVAARRKSASAN